MTVRKSAFCPGHITAFFEIRDDAQEPLKKGSRGAGLCISLGARSTVSIEDSSWQELKIRIDGRETDAPVTRDALNYMLGDRKLRVEVDTALDLPMEQGFAMSAAGSLSAALAACEAIGIDHRKAFEAAHIAEVKNLTGLGDVAGISAGAMDLRVEPGLPPFGRVERIDIEAELVLSVLGKPIKTPGILRDPEKRRAISVAGNKCVTEFSEHKTLEHLFALGMEFVEEAGLISPEVLRGIMAAEEHGISSMVMLGNSIFCAGETKELMKDLRPLGHTYRCEIDRKGPRIL